MNLREKLTPKNMIMGSISLIALVGAYLNAMGDILCFPIWLFTNLIFAASAYMDKNRWMVFVFLVYFSTSILGLKHWMS